VRTARRIGIAIVALVLLGGFLSKRLGFQTKRIYLASASVDEGAVSNAPRPPFMAAVAAPPTQISAATEAPAPEKTGGFDGKRAYDLVAKQVSFGPRPAGSPAIIQLQNFLESELKSYGCTVETDSFNSDTPAGRLPMKNILVKISGEKPGVILLGTHYDTKRLDNFVGADDAGSSTAVMLELARHLCKQHGRYAVWIAFFDGEEAVRKEWVDPDNRYGSRQMAARFANSGDLKKIRAFLLADIVGGRNLRIKRESDSTKDLVDVIWSTAGRLGYSDIFVNDSSPVSDDHDSFLKRNIPSADVIALDAAADYWHTPQDAMDKISPKSLAIVGHVFLESIKQLQSR
jgi:glutaminyl-peptide cyclotransferase